MLEKGWHLGHRNFLRDALTLALFVAGCDRGADERTLRLLPGSEEIVQRVLETEDSRTRDPSGHFTFLEGISWPDPEVQRISVRALGRQENPSVLVDIGSMLASPYPAIRAEAVNASVQAVTGRDPRRAMAALVRFLPIERDPEVRGAVLEAMGRFSYENPGDAQRAYDVLLDNLVGGAAGGGTGAVTLRAVPHPVILGGARALEGLVRTQSQLLPPDPSALSTLVALARYEGPGAEEGAQVRRLALAGLVGTGNPPGDVIETSLADEDAQVRRLAVLAVGEGALEAARPSLVRALADPSHLVRVEAVRAWTARVGGSEGCSELVGVARGPERARRPGSHRSPGRVPAGECSRSSGGRCSHKLIPSRRTTGTRRHAPWWRWPASLPSPPAAGYPPSPRIRSGRCACTRHAPRPAWN